ncbi:MAG TPA: 3'-5' exonuclease [Candidatus Paceibacterota bacterium]|nr:3'-5' exonuclease [Candidatus Paceibacterota bacterium]
MLPLPDSFVIFDTEYTAWEGSWQRGWNQPGEYKEIVQIGALIADGKTLEERDTFLVLVKPLKNPLLSEYFKDLTGISQESLEREGVNLEEALSRFRTWIGERDCYSFGDDSDVLEENCELIDIPFPFPEGRFYDVRDVFKAAGTDVSHLSSGTVTRAFGKEPERRAHDALADARTILDGLRELARLIK